MDIDVYNKKLEHVNILDTYESIIWADRYVGCGNFEIITAPDTSILSMIKKGYYLSIRSSSQTMIVEDILIKNDAEEGNKFQITGRSLESILTRRIIWNQTQLKGNLQNGVKKLLDENIISPTDAARKIPNFIFESSTDPLITGLEFEGIYWGNELYEVIENMCNINQIGFEVIINSSNQFVFRLVAGADRSYSQSLLPYVVFSPKFDNLANSNYLESEKLLKNVTYVIGEGEGETLKTTVVGEGSGIDRREIVTDATSVSSTQGDTTITAEEYIKILKDLGKETLDDNKDIKSFEASIDSTQTFIYGRDFFIGDIVQILNEYGMEARCRMVELVQSESPSGIEVVPTFMDIT